MKLVLLCWAFAVSSAFAGTWTCELGKTHSGTYAYDLKLSGDRTGVTGATADVTVGGIAAGQFPVKTQQPESGEFQRLLVGVQDPKSKMLLRMMDSFIEDNVRPASMRLVYNPIPYDFDGTCTLSE